MGEVSAVVRERATQTFDSLLRDARFRRLISPNDWILLPPAVRQRFSKRLANGATAIYVGEVVKVSCSRLGWWLAQAARLIGGPLPLTRDIHVPSIVTATEDIETGGQIWTRLYARRHGFPQVVQSSKRFSGPTGLEEYVGYGVVMALNVFVENHALLFRSAGYFLQFGKRWLRIPDWLTPGALTVTHQDLGNGSFLFRLEVVHRRLGV